MSPVYFMFFGAIGALVPYLSVHYHNIGLTGTQIGLVISVQPIVLFISQPIFGPLTDRSGHRGRVLAWVLGLTGITALIMMIGRSFWALLPLVALWSFFAGLIGPTADSIALGEVEATGVAYPRLRLWGSIGFLIVTIGMGWLYNRISLLWAFPVYALFMWTGVFFALRLPREGAMHKQPAWRDLWRLVKNPLLLAFLFLCMVLQMTLAANTAFFSVHFTGIGGSSGLLGLAWGVAALVEVPAWLLLGEVTRRTGPLPLVAFAGATYALRWWLTGSVTSPALMVGLMTIQSLSYAVFMPTAVVFVGELTPPELRTSGQALLGLVTAGLATLLGSYFGGLLVDRVGTAGMYHLMTYVALAASAGFLLLILARLYLRKRREAMTGG